MSKQLFDSFNQISEIFNNNVVEISVKRHQISLELNQKTILLQDIDKFYNQVKVLQDSFIATNEDSLFIVCGLSEGVLEDTDMQGLFKDFISVTEEIFEKVCKCPVFEFVVSDKYIKIYLDKQGLTTEDLNAYEEIFQLKGEGTLELHPQRPYLLFVNTNIEEV